MNVPCQPQLAVTDAERRVLVEGRSEGYKLWLFSVPEQPLRLLVELTGNVIQRVGGTVLRTLEFFWGIRQFKHTHAAGN